MYLVFFCFETQKHFLCLFNILEMAIMVKVVKVVNIINFEIGNVDSMLFNVTKFHVDIHSVV